MFTVMHSLYLRVMVLSRRRVDRASEHGDLHFGHQRVVDGCVCQPGTIRRPPVCDVGLKDLRCTRKIQEFLSVIFHCGSITRIIAGIVKSNHPWHSVSQVSFQLRPHTHTHTLRFPIFIRIQSMHLVRLRAFLHNHLFLYESLLPSHRGSQKGSGP